MKLLIAVPVVVLAAIGGAFAAAVAYIVVSDARTAVRRRRGAA